jgi:ATP-dependent Clp protease ATP-binding subunit ClpB
MTSNLGSDAILEFGDQDRRRGERRVVERALRQHFRPEFLNRLDETVIFRQLTREQIRHIVELHAVSLQRMLQERGVTLVLTEAARDALADEGYDPHFGARPLKRTLQRRVQNPLAMKLLEGVFKTGDTVELDHGRRRLRVPFGPRHTTAGTRHGLTLRSHFNERPRSVASERGRVREWSRVVSDTAP